MNRKQKGFTLIELLIVVAIIGILAAIAIPNLLTAMQRSKQKRTMADMRTIATAWEARATDMNRYNAAGLVYPTGNVTWDNLNTYLCPTYIKSLPTKDGWNTASTATSSTRTAASSTTPKASSSSKPRTSATTVERAPQGALSHIRQSARS